MSDLMGPLTDRISVVSQNGIDLGTVWGRVRTLSYRRELGDATHSVAIRFRSDVGPGAVVTYRGHRLNVVTADDMDGRRSWLSMRAIEATP